MTSSVMYNTMMSQKIIKPSKSNHPIIDDENIVYIHQKNTLS